MARPVLRHGASCEDLLAMCDRQHLNELEMAVRQRDSEPVPDHAAHARAGRQRRVPGRPPRVQGDVLGLVRERLVDARALGPVDGAVVGGDPHEAWLGQEVCVRLLIDHLCT